MTLYKSKIISIVVEAADTISYLFEKPEGFTYKAGQYIRVVLKSSCRKRDSRYFSLSSAPYEKFLQITVKIKPSPFREALYDLEEGLSIEYYGPIGVFAIEAQAPAKYMMLSGGVGVAPLFSILKQLSYNHSFTDVFFLGSYKEPSDVLFEDELKLIGTKSKGHIKIWHTLTRIFPEKQRQHVMDFKEMLLKEARHMGDPLWLVSGSEKFVDDVKLFLFNCGVDQDRIFTEKFL